MTNTLYALICVPSAIAGAAFMTWLVLSIFKEAEKPTDEQSNKWIR